MTLPDDDSLMLAYVYGELSDDEARAFEARLDADAGLRAEVDGLLATRDLLKEDARYGEVSGADLPPPHLTEAILRAEVLARPPEVRQAHAASGGGGFLARIQLWLVGGGLAVGAAAALVLVVKDDGVLKPEVAAEAALAPQQEPMAAAKPTDAKADLVGGVPAEPLPVPAGEAQTATFSDDEPAFAPADAPEGAVAGGRSKKKGTSLDGAPLEELPARAAPASVAQKARAADARERGLALDSFGAGDGEAYADTSSDDAAVAGKGAPPLSRGDVAANAEPMAEQKRAKSERTSRSDALTPAPMQVAEAESAPLESSRDELQVGAGGSFATGASGGLQVDEKPGAGPPSTETRRRGAASSGAPAASAPTAAPPGPPPLPEAARRQLAKKRAERSRARAPAKDTKDKATANQALSEELQLSLLTAERELQEGRALEALDLFVAVTQRDPRGALTGVVPYVGQMRALQALARHREVLTLLPAVKRPGIRATGVPEGILVAARSAEALGDVALARTLYRELLVVKDKRQEAEAALERLDAARRANEGRYDVDEPAASAAPPEE